MTYADLPAKNASDTLDLDDYDQIKDNFEAGVPAVVSAKGDLVAGSDVQAVARLAVGADDATLVADSGQTTGLAWQIQPAARVYNNAAFDPTPDTWVSVTFNSERYDTNGAHSTASDTSRLTVPSGGDGIYSIGGCVQFDTDGLAGAGGSYGVRILLNGSIILAIEQEVQALTIELCRTVHTEYALAAGDYVELQVYTTQDVNILASGNFSPEFWFRWERRS